MIPFRKKYACNHKPTRAVTAAAQSVITGILTFFNYIELYVDRYISSALLLRQRSNPVRRIFRMLGIYHHGNAQWVVHNVKGLLQRISCKR